jgi:hypothetical protein
MAKTTHYNSHNFNSDKMVTNIDSHYFRCLVTLMAGEKMAKRGDSAMGWDGMGSSGGFDLFSFVSPG